MIQQNYNVIGVMSGTSLDGADLAHFTFSLSDGKWAYTIGETETIPYTAAWVKALQSAVDFNKKQLAELDADYTALLGGMVNEFITRHSLKDVIVSSHGHTILHRPDEGITYQIGNRAEIAKITGVKVVCDFRVQDVALGGQGAPLVPIGDALLFADYAYCLNLGGFSNVSFDDDNGIRLAYDICAVNTVLNYYAAQLGFEYDNGGQLAAGGQLAKTLLAELNALEFYSLPYPKSLGFEYVKTVLLPLIEKYDIPVKDKLRTFTEHVAIQIVKSIGNVPNKELLVTGGGAYNTFLIDKIRALLPGFIVTVPDDKTIQYKEALIFALLGVLRVRGEVNVLASVTGAKRDHSSGVIFEP